MSTKSIARQEYEAAYRSLRLLAPRSGDSRTVTYGYEGSLLGAAELGSLIESKHGLYGSKAILSYNQRGMTQWKLMRHHNRLKNAAQRKSWGMKAFGKAISSVFPTFSIVGAL